MSLSSGFDGIAVGRMIEPDLATIVQPSRIMGERAAEILIDRLETGKDAAPVVLEHTFLPGGTLGNAPAGWLEAGHLKRRK